MQLYRRVSQWLNSYSEYSHDSCHGISPSEALKRDRVRLDVDEERHIAMSVDFNDVTFPDLRSTCSWRVICGSAIAQPTKPTQPSILSGR